MKTVTVAASRTYDVKIGPGVLGSLGLELALMSRSRRVCVVSDTNVWPLWGQATLDSLRKYHIKAETYIIPAGEASKNGTVFMELLDYLCKLGLTREDSIVALGGGVVGDLAGFVASCYLRGIRLVQVPTTLLAAVDSSVGGKTAINLPAGKNLAGSFYQPSLVLCDTNLLDTLPMSIFRDGCAEVVKYAILYDPEFFAYLEETGPEFDREKVIARCVELKRDAVIQDERDTGARMYLNLGHTVGHGIEYASDFTVTHGQAVAIGICIACRACHCRDTDRIVKLLQRFKLPTSTLFSADVLNTYTLADKKRLGDTIQLILPLAIGDCGIRTLPVNKLQCFIQAGL